MKHSMEEGTHARLVSSGLPSFSSSHLLSSSSLFSSISSLFKPAFEKGKETREEREKKRGGKKFNHHEVYECETHGSRNKLCY